MLPYLHLLLSFLYLPYFSWAGKPTNVTVEWVGTTTIRCPFTVSARFGTDFTTLALEYTSTSTSIKDAGSGTNECFATVAFVHDAPNVTIAIGSANVQGSVTLFEDDEAKIDIAVFWSNDNRLVCIATVSPVKLTSFTNYGYYSSKPFLQSRLAGLA